MNKQGFLSEVRQGINNKSTDSLKKLVLEFARLIPRSSYDEALSSLEKRNSIVVKNTPVDLLTAVEQLCKSVRNGDYDLTWDYEDDYGYDGYWDEDTLTDRDGLGEEINGLLETAIEYMNQKRYPDVLSAFDKLFSLEIPLENYEDLGILDLFSNDLIEQDITEILRYYAYTVLMVLRGNARAQKLYDIMGLNNYGMKMQEIAQAGIDDIPERREFEEQWINYLMNQNLYHRENILIDSVKFSGGIEALHSFTMEHGGKYQTAYTNLANEYIAQMEYSKAVSVITDGFVILVGVNKNRAKIADLLLEIGISTNDKSIIEKAAWEGFISSADLSHFINIYNLKDENVKSAALEYMGNLPGKRDDHNYIRFLYGDYTDVYNVCSKDKKYLGWSSSEKGRMLPLFIALLTGRNELPPCVKKLIKFTFPYGNFITDFYTSLADSFKDLPDMERKKYYDWCLKETDNRVEAIVRGLHRGSYNKASALIVSLAEAMCSVGDMAGAKKFIISYKEKYPRHSAFRAELQQDVGLANLGKLF